jgi:hypothetical protein
VGVPWGGFRSAANDPKLTYGLSFGLRPSVCT